MKALILILFWFSFGVSQVEVVKLSSKYAKTLYSDLALSNGATAIDDSYIYLAGKGGIYAQNKRFPDGIEKLPLDIKYSKYFSISSLLHEDGRLVMFYLGIDGMYYLCSVNMNGMILSEPKRKHGRGGRIIRTKDGLILQAGLYRPLYATYLDLYDDESGSGPSKLSKRKFKELYRVSDAFSLSFYDESFNLVDSAAILPLTGEVAEAYEHLYLTTPLDVSEGGAIFYIDHIDAYTVSELRRPNKTTKQYYIWNENFRPIPKELTKEEAETLNSTSGSYSRAYALYTDNTYILTSFVQNQAGGDPPAGPYYIDIITMSGEHVLSMVSSYPVVTEDHENKVFFAISRKGGWLESDELYLVGMTIQDVLNGLAEKRAIDTAIDQYKKLNQE